ncbi:MAG: HAD family phosphatase [Candidatus Rokubacteria bacterium]|nr:HAD family phosphatase [Candidatus Rokubacteria bacterium]
MSAAPDRPAVQAVIFDYGMVLSRAQRRADVAAMHRRVGAGARAFRTAYWRHRPAYDDGLDATTYWLRVLRDLRRLDRRDEIDTLIERDVSSWTDYRREAWQLAARLRRQGRRVGMLSNAVPEIVARIRKDWDLDRCFDDIVLSYEVGLLKPDPKIYRAALDRLGVAAEVTLFTDDRAVNVRAAEKVGMRGFVFAGPRPFERLKRAIGS